MGTSGSSETAGAATRVREELAGYVQRMLELAGRIAPPLTLPREPAPLSYAGGALLQIAPAMKQELLEEPSTDARLSRLLELLRQAQLEQEALLRLQREHPELGPLQDENGHGPITRN
jgi:hypothetical protein